MPAPTTQSIAGWWSHAGGRIVHHQQGWWLAAGAFFLVALLSLCGLALVNYAINPLYIYNDGKQLIRTGERIFFRSYTRVAKPHIITSREVSGIAFGSSRAEYALDPTHRLFGPNGYNGGLSGGSIYDMREMVYHTSEVARPHTMVLMVNTYDGVYLSNARGGLSPVENYTVLAASSDGKGTLLGHYTARFSLLVSSFQASLAAKNWRMRTRGYIPGVRYTATGQRYHPPERRPEEISEALNSFVERVQQSAAERPILALDPKATQALEQAVRRALTKLPDTRVIVITEPIHSSAYAANEFRSLYDHTTEAAVGLSRVVEKVSNTRAEFWDCALLNPMTQERVPEPSTAQVMAWWHDASHPNAAFGTRILDQLADRQKTGGPCARVSARTEDAYRARRAADKSAGIADGLAQVREMLARR